MASVLIPSRFYDLSTTKEAPIKKLLVLGVSAGDEDTAEVMGFMKGGQ